MPHRRRWLPSHNWRAHDLLPGVGKRLPPHHNSTPVSRNFPRPFAAGFCTVFNLLIGKHAQAWHLACNSQGGFYKWHRTVRLIKSLGFTRACAAASKLCSLKERYFTIDNVNLAFSLEKFDPRIHQPQPPGYPFFVFFARIVNVIFGNAERTFIAVSLVASAAASCVAFALAGRMFSRWAGAAAAFLLLVNPVFWHASLDGPLRPHLALFSLLTAFCCWRCWNGEKRFAYWGAVALGVGSGFRPDLIAFLSPLWLVSAWAGTKSWRSVTKAGAALAGIVVVWVAGLIIAMGGVGDCRKVVLADAGGELGV